MSPPQITVVGEALADLVLKPGATEPEAFPGGGPANIAVGLARLGCSATLLTQLGDDAHGRLVRSHLESNGVQVIQAGPADARTSTALARLDTDGVAQYEFDLTWQVRDLKLPSTVHALHIGSLGLALDPGAEQVVALTERASHAGRALVSFDPNVRPSITPDRGALARRVQHIVALSDVVKLSTEDLRFLYPDTSPEALADRWLNHNPRTALVVVTAGADGAFAAMRRRRTYLSALPVTLADTVGAGDAFMSALLAGLAQENVLSPSGLASAPPEVLERSLHAAVAAAAVTCSRPGADPPTSRELRSLLGLPGSRDALP